MSKLLAVFVKYKWPSVSPLPQTNTKLF